MCVCMYVCMYVCMLYVCVCACMHVCIYVSYLCVHVCMHACMHACLCVCMHVCVCVCANILCVCNTRTHARTHAQHTHLLLRRFLKHAALIGLHCDETIDLDGARLADAVAARLRLLFCQSIKGALLPYLQVSFAISAGLF